MSKIQLSNVCKSFGLKTVLKGINLEIAEGESLVIIGGSGTGKSVLIKCMLNLLPADSGSILIDGHEVVGESGQDQMARLSNIGVVFQGSALFDSLTVWENVAFGLMNEKKMARKDARDKATERLKTVGLNADVGSLYPSELSGGMQRRVALARAIATDPKLIFFDEPTAGLDPIFCGVINDIIRRCVSDLGATAITITHDLHSARHIADNVAMIHGGQIIWHGKAKNIDQSQNPYVEQFIAGSPTGPITQDAERVA
jgi:phospholipid/cholesterol/gamma-HCH transport system ATP-binding protein